MADRISYWHIEDIEFARPSVTLALIDKHVRELISTLR
jgi:protein-tyrosine phosphatase